MPKGDSPNSRKNLVPFEKGHEKLGGRKKGTLNMTTRLRNYLETSLTRMNLGTHKAEKKKVGDWIILALTYQAMKGNVPAIGEIFDRIDGKVPNKVEGKMDMDLTIDELKKLSDHELRKRAYGDI